MKSRSVAICASNIRSGGALQVSISFFSCLMKLDSLHTQDLIIIVSHYVHNELVKLSCFDSNIFKAYIVHTSNVFPAPLRKSYLFLKCKTILTIFGPMYFPFKLFFPWIVHITGFALPDLIYAHTTYKGVLYSFKKYLRLLLFKYCYDFYIVETMSARKRLSEVLKVSPSIIKVVPNSISLSLFEDIQSIPNNQSKTTRPISPKKIVLGFLGNAYPHKNVSFLIQSVNRINAQKLLPTPLYLILTCDHPESTGNYIVDLGSISPLELEVFYSQIDIAVTASVLECFSIFPIESMCFNKPVLASDIEPHIETLKQHAQYFKANSFQSFYESLSTLLEKIMFSDMSSYTQLSREYALTYYNPVKRASAFLEVARSF